MIVVVPVYITHRGFMQSTSPLLRCLAASTAESELHLVKMNVVAWLFGALFYGAGFLIYEADGICQTACELLEIFRIDEDLVFLKTELWHLRIAAYGFLALSNREVHVAMAVLFDIHVIYAFACFNGTREENLPLAVS